MYLFVVVFFTYLIFSIFDAFSIRKTYRGMKKLKDCVLAYTVLNKKPPVSLREMIGAGGIECSVGDIKDKWGRPIIYQVDSADNVRLISLGADGAAGGKDEAADIVIKFKVK
jgi:hypothetical protein